MQKKINKLRDKLFSKVHTNYLIYNTCWEDSRIDRELLGLDQNSEVVMITSAGCNALNYSLDNPKTINCIDVNPRQNSLLELKKACIRNGDFDLHFSMFGRGRYKNIKDRYEKELKPFLPDYAVDFWNKKIGKFSAKGKKKSFYFFGTSGSFAWLFKKYFDSKKGARELIGRLLTSNTMEEQKEIYDQLEPKFLNRMTLWLMNRHLTLALLGVPRAQLDLILKKYPDAMAGFVKTNLRHVFTELPINDNYFWRLYLTGKYTKACSPEYLKEHNFKNLQRNVDALKTHTTTISGFLRDNPRKYSHYILLDHQDWLAHNLPEALDEEWELILKNSKPGTKILMRSAAPKIDFFPEFVQDRIDWDMQKAEEVHTKDRVGTYASTYMGVVK
ncbi:MAG: BtaA family protein [Bacteroidota bacterium]